MLKCMSFTLIAFILTCSNPVSPVNPKMLQIPAGTFLMGSAIRQGDWPWESPAHQVSISTFEMDETEITQQQFLNLMGYNPSYYTDNLQAPVDGMTWYEAVLYCNERSKLNNFDTVYSYTSQNLFFGGERTECDSLLNLKIDYSKNGFRLPTEAEWEYACRAGTTTKYYWGNTLNYSYCWANFNSIHTETVKQKLPNNFGLYDMIGNAWEYCNDYPNDYSDSSQTDPSGPTEPAISYRIVRGGSYYELPNHLTCSYRDDMPAGIPNSYLSIGFRCVKR